MKTNDQVWDPKNPKNLPIWFYDEPRAEIAREDSPWRVAFAAVVAAEAAGELADLHAFRRGTRDEWTWRSGLWDLYYKPMFQQHMSTWPAYARAVYDAVPADWLDSPGSLDGIPTWWTDLRLIWAFKATLLLVSGLIEGKLPRIPLPETAPEARGSAGREPFGEVLDSRPPLVADKSGNLEQLLQASVARAFESGVQPILHRLDVLERRSPNR